MHILREKDMTVENLATPIAVWPRLDPFRTGIRGWCPRCGKGHIFRGFLAMRAACEVCGLSYAYADPADGPPFFAICIGCVPAVLFALWIEMAFAPPVWVHLLLSLPFMLLVCILPLRPLKGWLVCSQYFFKAGEGRLAQPWTPYEGGLTVPAAADEDTQWK